MAIESASLLRPVAHGCEHIRHCYPLNARQSAASRAKHNRALEFSAEPSWLETFNI